MIYYVYKYNGKEWAINSVIEDNGVSDFFRMYKDCKEPLIIKSDNVNGNIENLLPFIMDVVVFKVEGISGSDRFFYKGNDPLFLPYLYVTPNIVYIRDPYFFMKNIDNLPSSIWTLFIIAG